MDFAQERQLDTSNRENLISHINNNLTFKTGIGDTGEYGVFVRPLHAKARCAYKIGTNSATSHQSKENMMARVRPLVRRLYAKRPAAGYRHAAELTQAHMLRSRLQIIRDGSLLLHHQPRAHPRGSRLWVASRTRLRRRS